MNIYNTRRFLVVSFTLGFYDNQLLFQLLVYALMRQIEIESSLVHARCAQQCEYSATCSANKQAGLPMDGATDYG